MEWSPSSSGVNLLSDLHRHCEGAQHRGAALNMSSSDSGSSRSVVIDSELALPAATRLPWQVMTMVK